MAKKKPNDEDGDNNINNNNKLSKLIIKRQGYLPVLQLVIGPRY